MELPYRFPDPMEEAVRRAEEFRKLPPDERCRQLFDVIEAGIVLARENPRREVIDRLFEEREAEWQRIQRKLFRRHGF